MRVSTSDLRDTAAVDELVEGQEVVFSVAGQVWAPRAVVGRVTATVSTMTFGGIALGSWLWGHFAERFGIAAAVAASGAAMLLVAGIGLMLPMPRQADAPEQEAG